MRKFLLFAFGLIFLYIGSCSAEKKEIVAEKEKGRIVSSKKQEFKTTETKFSNKKEVKTKN